MTALHASCGAAASRAPTLEARGQALILSIADGSQVQIERYGEDGEALGTPEDVLTRDEVQNLIRDGLDDNKALFEAELEKATAGIKKAVMAELSKSTDAKVARLETQVARLEEALAPLKKTVGEMQKQVGDASGATDDAVTCLAGMIKAGAGGSWVSACCGVWGGVCEQRPCTPIIGARPAPPCAALIRPVPPRVCAALRRVPGRDTRPLEHARRRPVPP